MRPMDNRKRLSKNKKIKGANNWKWYLNWTENGFVYRNKLEIIITIKLERVLLYEVLYKSFYNMNEL